MAKRMRFQTIGSKQPMPLGASDVAILVDDFWDDYRFKTSFLLKYLSSDGTIVDCGQVKVLQRGMLRERVVVPNEFLALPEEYCSLGQNQSYYETLRELPDGKGFEILRALRDVAFSKDLYDEFQSDEAFQVSLMRSVNPSGVLRFRKILLGEFAKSRFEFTYEIVGEFAETRRPLSFKVVPESLPPTNIHAFIGRNGVGKTTLLGRMAEAVCLSENLRQSRPELGRFEFGIRSDPAMYMDGFANVIGVSFSAFDNFPIPTDDGTGELDVQYVYVGVRSIENSQLKSFEELTQDFVASVAACVGSARLESWRRAIETLSSDPGFERLQIEKLSNAHELQPEAAKIFRSASAGHRLVLLTLAKLVELVGERTLVLFDEPEAHLHPPLLGSLIRALSELLMSRNGVAIIATHSPVVLQELPKKCVWILTRFGDSLNAARPVLETFGENVGVLTQEAFGLEVARSGHHALIKQIVSQSEVGATYEEIATKFDGQLGTEAASILLALIGQRNR